MRRRNVAAGEKRLKINQRKADSFAFFYKYCCNEY